MFPLKAFTAEEECLNDCLKHTSFRLHLRINHFVPRIFLLLQNWEQHQVVEWINTPTDNTISHYKSIYVYSATVYWGNVNR